MCTSLVSYTARGRIYVYLFGRISIDGVICLWILVDVLAKYLLHSSSALICVYVKRSSEHCLVRMCELFLCALIHACYL